MSVDAAFSGAKYAGYTSGGETIATRAGATGGTADTISISNRVAINYAASSGIYSDTLTYTVTPNYN
jgi:spore coat protein U-like protein